MPVFATLGGIYFLFALAGAGVPAERWDAAGSSASGICTVAAASGSTERRLTIESRTYLRLVPSANLYTRAALEIAVSQPAPGWLSLQFLDRGYGLITLEPRLPDTSKWGVARVNSDRMRRAVFRVDRMPSSKKFRVEGIDFLHAVEWSHDQPALEHAPLVEPAIKFNRPSERVTTACVDGPSPANLEEVLAGLRNHLPLARALGFNGVETFVRWGWAEREPGKYDWRYFDRVVDEIERHGMSWSPMLLAGSGYAVPAWWHDARDYVGFQCLEHGIVHDTPSIFQPGHADMAARFLTEFGRHFRGRSSLLAVRLGPSGDFGEAQYPARGPGYNWRRDNHTHIGHWAGDAFARADFRQCLERKYRTVDSLNVAWKTTYPSFAAIEPFLPVTARERRQRLDFATWYMGAMSDWCNRWASWARQSLPRTSLHQSAGGWGPVEIGTDYSALAKGMAAVRGGVRLTNEGDDFADNFTVTRMASSAARFYDLRLGFEPAGFGSKRGVMARLFNALTNGAVHLFYYQGNLTGNDQAIDAWLRHAHLFDLSSKPVIDVAVFYPDTAIKLDDEVVRYRFASTLFTMARSLRERLDFDYASEPMILDGALDRYKVLLLLWGSVTERNVLECIDRWVRGGGILIVAPGRRGHPTTVEGDSTVADRWRTGDTGKGRYIIWPGDPIPALAFSDFIRDTLLGLPNLHSRTVAALAMEKPNSVFWSILENGHLALLNFSNHPTTIRTPTGKTLRLEPYGIELD